MATKKKLLEAAAGSAGGQVTNVETVFSNYVYTGSGSTQTITNNLDLSTEGGLIWAKNRTTSQDHYLFDTERSLATWLETNKTTAENSVSLTLNSVAFGNSTYIAATNFGFFKSTDGTTWSEVTDTDVAGKDFARVKYINSRFIAASSSKEWATSTDGTNWTTSTITTGTINANNIFYANGVYMVQGSGSTVYISSDHGSTWSSQSVGISYTYTGSAGNAFVAISGNAGVDVRYSTNGTTWNSVSVDSSGATSVVQFDENTNILYAQFGYARLKYTTNGSSWGTAFSTSSGLEFIVYPAYAPDSGRYYFNTSGFAGGTTRTLTSTDGTSFTDVGLASTGVYGPIATDGTNFIIGTSGSTYYTSSTGASTSWTSRTAPTGITATNRLFQAGGRAFIGITNGGQFSNNDDVTNTTTWDTEAVASPNLISVSSTGFSLLTSEANTAGQDFSAWTFLKSEGFFDCIQYTGNGVAGRTISHNLNSNVGMLIVKKTSSTDNWFVWHRGLTDATYRLLLNDSAGETVQTNAWNSTAPTSTEFTLGDNSNVNQSGETYIAYLFAHNDGNSDIIKCGNYSGTGTTNEITLGFEPQWLLVKRINSADSWPIVDSMRLFTADGDVSILRTNSNSGDVSGSSTVRPTATGFQLQSSSGEWNASGGSYIYMAIRRGPMAEPTAGTDVFDLAFDGATDNEKPYIRSAMGVVDLIIANSRTGTTYHRPVTRLTSGRYLQTTNTAAEVTQATWTFDFQNGVYDLAGSSVNTNGISWMWKRAPSFCDVVAYTGNGTAGHTVSHNLGVAPEMMWIKSRDNARDWRVYHSALGASNVLNLNSASGAFASTSSFNGTDPDASNFTLGSLSVTNGSTENYTAYLFASLDGVSKVGSFTGNGSTLNVDCGFSSGARFVIIKRDSGPWRVFDTERGIVAGGDPFLNLNNTDAEVSSVDLLDPYSSGFTVNFNSDYGFNTNGDTFYFYAIA